MPDTIPDRQPKLLDQLRNCIRNKHYSFSTERTYVYWARWYIRYHGLRHPKDMGPGAIRAFLSYMNNERQIAGATYKPGIMRIALFIQRSSGHRIALD